MVYLWLTVSGNMKILRVFYYYTYLWNDKILKEGNPHLQALLSICFLIGFNVSEMIALFVAYCKCINLSLLYSALIILALYALFYFGLYKTSVVKNVVKSKPKLYNNNRLSAVVTIAFTVGLIILMIIMPIITRDIIKAKCGQ